MQSYIFVALFCCYFIGVPILLTIWNLCNLCIKKPFLPGIGAFLTICIGLLDYFLLYIFLFEPAGEWYEAIYTNQVHNLLSGQYVISLIIPLFVGCVGLFTLFIFKPEKLSPIISALSIASVVVLNAIQML